MTTAALSAVRRAFPNVHISFAVGGWSREALAGHPDIDDYLDTGSSDLPTSTLSGLIRFVWQLRAGRYDLAISLVRSAKMSLALLLSGIPYRAGIYSGGRGFGYQFRAKIDRSIPQHESKIFLDVVGTLSINTTGCTPNIPLQNTAAETLEIKMKERGIKSPYFVLHPGGGENPGMRFLTKRWPLGNFAVLASRLAKQWDAHAVWLVGKNERPIINALPDTCRAGGNVFIGNLNFAEIAQLAAHALVYIGNDSGLSHLAAASGARVATIFGPSDPRRYAPIGPAAITLYRSRSYGSALGSDVNQWDWARDGISVAEAEAAIIELVARNR